MWLIISELHGSAWTALARHLPKWHQLQRRDGVRNSMSYCPGQFIPVRLQDSKSGPRHVVSTKCTFHTNHTIGQAGTFWYHSHVSTQYCDGLRGPLVVYDPQDPYADLYDIDDGQYFFLLMISFLC